MHSTRTTRCTATLFLLAMLALAGEARAKTFVIPHLLEVSGNISNTQFTFDSHLYATYTPGLISGLEPSSATLDVFLYNQSTGQPLRSATNAEVCNPCSYLLGADAAGSVVRKVSLSMDDLIMNAGGFPGGVVLGYGVVVVGGENPDGVALQGFVTNAHTSAFDLSVFGYEPQPIQAQGGAVRTWVVPHVFEMQGRITNTQYTFDTQLFATYTAGLAGSPGGAGAQLDLYLFHDSGLPWMGANNEVCNPCTFPLSDVQRKQSITLENLILASGGFPQGFSLLDGFAVLLASGDVGPVAMQGFVVNAHTNAFDLSVFGYEPQEMSGEGLVSVISPDRSGAALSLRASPNPARGEISFAYELGRDADVSLEVFDAAGRRVGEVVSERAAAGPASARWTPKDSSGNRLPSGVYYARLAAADGSRMTRVVFLPN